MNFFKEKNIKLIPFLVLVILSVILTVFINDLDRARVFKGRAAGSAIDLSMALPSNQQLAAGTEFTVDVLIDGTNMTGVAPCIQSSDPSTLELVSIASTNVFSTALLPGSITNGQAHITLASIAPISGAHTFAQLNVRSLHTGSANLSFCESEAYDTQHENSNIGQMTNQTVVIGRSIVQNPAAIQALPSTTSLQQGQTVTVDIQVNTQHRVVAGKYCYSYGPQLEGISFQPATSLPLVLSQGSFSNGQVCFEVGADPNTSSNPQERGVTGQFSAGTLTFRAIGNGTAQIVCLADTDLAAIGVDANTLSLVGQCGGTTLTIGGTTSVTVGPPTPTKLPNPTSVPQSTSVPQPTSLPKPTPIVVQPTTVLQPTASTPLPTGASCTSDAQCQIFCVKAPCPVGKCTNNHCQLVNEASCQGNITGPRGQLDDIVDLLDLNYLGEIWADFTKNGVLDFDNNGHITINDFRIFVENFGCTTSDGSNQ